MRQHCVNLPVAIAVALASLAIGMSPGAAQPISRTNFNWNPPPCPNSGRQILLLAPIGTSTFGDGTPLPSCGATLNGGPAKLVWDGHAWRVAAAPVPRRVPLQQPHFVGPR